MGKATTFNNAVRIGDRENAGRDHVKALGFATVAQSALVAFGDAGAAVDVCTVPAGSQIIEIYVDVLTAFNGGGSDLLDLGKAGAATHFADNLDLSSAARLRASTDVSQLANFDDVGTDQVTIQALYADAGADASAGSARVTVVYVPNNNLEA